jgi:ABC-type multidrug transport system ATPase subunit
MSDSVSRPESDAVSAGEPAPCIEIRDFEAKSPEITLRIPSLSVKRGSFCALLAKSGGGKSVLLSVLTGHLLGPWMRKKKAIHFDRFIIGETQLTPDTFAYPARLRESLKGENLVYLPQKFPDDRSMKRRCLSEMADIVGAIAPNCPRRAAKQILIENSRKLGLEGILKQSLKDLSGGERKRIEIIARLCGVEMQDKEDREAGVVFLLDEPTTGLDVAAQRQYFLFLKDTKNVFQDIDITFVIATHALSLLEEEDGGSLFDCVLYVRKQAGEAEAKNCQLSYCGGVREFVRSAYHGELSGKGSVPSEMAPPAEECTHPPSDRTGKSGLRPARRKGGVSLFLSTFDEELRRANGKQFEGKDKRMVFAIPFLVGLIVFAAFLARNDPDPERFIFFSTIYAFWIGIFNSCQIVNGAVASGEWNYWVLALRRSFFNYILANALVSFLLSLVQLAVFAGAILLFSCLWGNDSLFNVFIAQSQLPDYFMVQASGLSRDVIVSILFLGSLAMAAIAGAGIGTLISSVTKDTLSALKVSVGVVVVSMVSSTTVLKSDGKRLPVTPPLYLKWACPAPVLSSPAVFTSKDSNAGFWPHLLEDASLLLPQRYFFNVGRGLDKDILELAPSYLNSPKTSDFEYSLPPGDLADHWEHWKDIRRESQLAEKRAELSAKGESLNEAKFLPAMAAIIGLEALACGALSALFFFGGTLIAIRDKDLYEIH